jgi:hypothetical protein
MAFDSITIHNVDKIELSEPRKLESSDNVVRTLRIRHDGGVTSLHVFASHESKLRILQT